LHLYFSPLLAIDNTSEVSHRHDVVNESASAQSIPLNRGTVVSYYDYNNSAGDLNKTEATVLFIVFFGLWFGLVVIIYHGSKRK